MISNNGSWHSDTIERLKGLTIDSLLYIRADCFAASIAGKDHNAKVSQYLDLFHYCNMELKKRGAL